MDITTYEYTCNLYNLIDIISWIALHTNIHTYIHKRSINLTHSFHVSTPGSAHNLVGRRATPGSAHNLVDRRAIHEMMSMRLYRLQVYSYVVMSI